ncbi:terminase large subunit [Roseivirga pacifica]|uniref:terminase large subunit n=1 Tax=Roseivirga pacifica TaxID=1267423 RepID=UPI002096524B|nr:terminase TerL endonuclease subunit [Roseivirga pacifica]MCO6358198.1 hypothetical protein [Roseivirga pacifica]MCO6366636.1 hypothetical protein [Roseivirga pacifica]MCO6371121.1 hypothetical protein [Roseivirga pacifica]MCO6373929.1 hypothetical protein [Roseivirga pacifica]MCO6380910.1 hypothetical protein [Roseivirga pacifica]
MHPADQYALDIYDGKIVSGDLMKKVVERYFHDLEHQETEAFPYYHDPEAAKTVINFLESCHHFEGRLAGQPLKLEPWQQFNIWNVFGWKKCSNNLRRFSTSYLQIAKKNGKSMISSGVALYGLSPLDGEGGPQVYAIATKEDQAKIVFNGAKKILNKSPILKGLYLQFAKSIHCPSSEGNFLPLGRDSDSQDGKHVHMVVVDEYHAHKSDELYNNVESGTAGREQSMVYVITTSGFNTAGPCYRMREACVNILNGRYKDETTFCQIYELDKEDWENDNWRNPKVWIKANPNMEVSITQERLQELLGKAEAEGSTKLDGWKVKNLNKWLTSYETWEAADHWHKCNHGKVDLELLKGKECYAGIDMASNNDLTAMTVTFPVQPGIELTQKLYYFFMPKDNVKAKQSQHKVDYQKWIELGYIEATEGNITDTAYVRKKLNEIANTYVLKVAHYDPYMLKNEAAVWAEEDELPLVELAQSIGYLAEPTKEYEKQIFAGKFNHGGNPVMSWMIGNCVMYRDPNLNFKIHKGKSSGKVDGPVSDVMSVYGTMNPPEEESVPGFYSIKVND